ncbi:MAG: MFS transporter [Lachnospiraceae bacterium]|jgi:MFS family permease
MNLIRENRNFRWLFTATLFNRFGDAIDGLTLSWLTYSVTNSASVSALNLAVNFIPTVFFQPLAGAWVVHHDPKKIMILADAVRAAIVVLLAVLVFTGAIQGWMIFVATFLISTAEAFRMPCGALVNVSILKKEEYSAGQSLMTSASSLVQLAGSAAAGALLSLCGIAVSLLMDALCFCMCALLQSMLRFVYRQKEDDAGKNTFVLFREGLGYIRGHRFIVTLTVMSVLLNALMNPISALSSAWCQTVFRKGAWALSYFNVFISLGMMIGAAVYRKWIEHKTWLKRLIIETYLACALYYLAWLAGGWLRDSWLFFVIASLLPFAAGMIIAFVNIRLSVTLLSVVDKNYLSRVDGIINSAVCAGIPVTSLITSAMAAFMPLQTIFIIFACLCLVCAVVCCFAKLSKEY